MLPLSLAPIAARRGNFFLLTRLKFRFEVLFTVSASPYDMDDKYIVFINNCVFNQHIWHKINFICPLYYSLEILQRFTLENVYVHWHTYSYQTPAKMYFFRSRQNLSLFFFLNPIVYRGTSRNILQLCYSVSCASFSDGQSPHFLAVR